MYEWLAVVPVGAILWLLFRQAIRRHEKWNDRYWAKADNALRELETDLAFLTPVLAMPHRAIRQPNGTVVHTRNDDKAIIEFMHRTGHRPALHRWCENLLDAGLVRLSHAAGLYHAYAATEGETWWKRQWWTGTSCLNYAELLAIERTVRRVYDDARRTLNGQPPQNRIETWREDLERRPLVEFPRHWFFKPHRIASKRWKHGQRPTSPLRRFLGRIGRLFVPRKRRVAA